MTLSVETVSMIRTTSSRGRGTEKDPNRIVEQYWKPDGTLLAEIDPNPPADRIHIANSIWRHSKSGGLYYRMGEATLQTDLLLGDMDKVVVYAAAKDGTLWARRLIEFRERFTLQTETSD